MQSRQLVTLWILEYSLSYTFALKHVYLNKIQMPWEKGLDPFDTLPPGGCSNKQVSPVVSGPEMLKEHMEIAVSLFSCSSINRLIRGK